jgi:hypothetical protein
MKIKPPLGSKPPKPDINKCNTVGGTKDHYTIHKNQRPIKTFLGFFITILILINIILVIVKYFECHL